MLFNNKKFFSKYQEMVNCDHKNAVVFHSQKWAGFNIPVRLSLKDIVVTKGKIKFILEDGISFYVEDNTLTHNIHTDKKTPSTDKYKSYMGKKSILKHHSNSAASLHNFTFGLAEKVDSYTINGNIVECIHDNVTTFIIMDKAIRNFTVPKHLKEMSKFAI